MFGHKAVSLFSNCGAGDIGYRQAGFNFSVMAELDPHRLEVCLQNHPGAVGVPGDLRKTWKSVIEKYRALAGTERPALLSACPPCQGMSSARSGKGRHEDPNAGSKDERNLLATVIVRVAKKLEPSIVVVENVPAFLSKKVHHPVDKNPVSAANFLIASLKKDYVVFPLVSDLCDFGIPQSRNRAFLTFIRKDVPGLMSLLLSKKIPFPSASHGPGTKHNHRTLAAALEKYRLPPLDASSALSARCESHDGLHFVPVWDSRFYAMAAAIPAGSGRSAWENDMCVNCGPVAVDNTTVTCPICFIPLPRPIVQEPNGSYRLVKGFRSSYRRMYPNRPAATITTASGHIGSDYTIHPTENRLLSPLECAIIQTFPKDFQWGDSLKRLGHTNIREMIGEAVPPYFTRKHGRILISLLSGHLPKSSMSCLDSRHEKAWGALSEAANKDQRANPRNFFNYNKPRINRKPIPANTQKVQ